jgi:subtilase family serine protease
VRSVRRMGACTAGVAVLFGGVAMTTGSVAVAASKSAARFVAVRSSSARTTDPPVGRFAGSRMSVEVVLAPQNQTALTSRLAASYDPSSALYHHWLARGQFNAMFAPSTATRAAVVRYLRASGLTVVRSSSPFLVRVTGTSARIAAAFRTSIATYRNPRGVSYFSNATAAKLPAAIAEHVQGVVGLTNTVRLHSMVARAKGSAPQSASAPSCEAPYPTRQQLFDHFGPNMTDFPTGYGGGPGCSGVTPSQTNSIYHAPNAGPRGRGKGVNLAVFELSAYQHSDIATWAHQFFGHRYTPHLVDVNVDGGPLNPSCPTGDTCPPEFNGYAGDIEVDADIQMQIAMSPANKHIVVYNAPNDFTGQTSLDEWVRIANDDRAAVVSSSWAICESDAGAGFVQAENILFVQMALQGQSVFGAAGDTGAFGCIRSDGSLITNLIDPPAQPWVTGVGGTSFERFNPGHQRHPSYPKRAETVWNVDNLCSSASFGGFQPFFFCEATGATGGGSSEFWGRPRYQHGPGVNNPFTTHGNGTTQCSLAPRGKPCREEPDISANADEYTPYSEFCTGSSDTPNSVCATFSGGATPPGWFGIGGTSLSSPIWSGIVADRVSFQGHRAGNINPLLYSWFRTHPRRFFHDITGAHFVNNNGLFPATRHFDEATGIGTPDMTAIITGR